MAEVAAPNPAAWMNSVELRDAIDRLPLDERQVVLLHYPEGCSSAEIASIVGAPARTVRRRLSQAREHLRQELGEDDLTYLNEPPAPMRQWAWLQLRSTSYYDDRRKEVPNRLLARWAAARRQQGMLTLDDLVEIAQLSDAQLDAREMAKRARACFGLSEWDLGRNYDLRPHLRFLAGVRSRRREATPGTAQRQEAMGPAGLAVTGMPLAQQQRFIPLALVNEGEGLQSLEELAGSALRVEYTQQGGFRWGEAGHPGQGHYTRRMVPLEAGPQGRRVLRPMVQERTREAALQAVRRVDPALREALLAAARRADSRVEPSLHVVEEDQIFPTRLDLCLVYMPGATNARGIQLQTSSADYGLRP